jgi:hypothetical protein
MRMYPSSRYHPLRVGCLKIGDVGVLDGRYFEMAQGMFDLYRVDNAPRVEMSSSPWPLQLGPSYQPYDQSSSSRPSLAA